MRSDTDKIIRMIHLFFSSGRKILLCHILAVFISLFIWCQESNGESLEQVINPRTSQNLWLSDMAGVIDSNVESQINSLINKLEQQTSAEIAVVTIQKTDGSTPKDFATNLFSFWDIGKKDKDNGVLILLVMEERRIEVETGYGAEGVLPDGKVGAILDEYAIPRFKEGDFGGGLLSVVKAMADVLSGEPIDTLSSAKAKRGIGISGIIKILLPLVLAALIIYGIRRSRVRHCKECGKRMRRLTEEQDDAYLSPSQKFEEGLGSVDYRVWRCDDCQINKIETRMLPFRNYKKCPKCEHQTLYIKSRTIKNPTYIEEGLKEIIEECRFPKCGYKNINRQIIPKLVQQRSGSFSSGMVIGTILGSASGRRSSGGGFRSGGFSGGSFGGGSSGGGGAGRSW